MEKYPTILVVSAGALIDAEGRVLIQRRPAGKSMAGLWEFPGGKVEPGEQPVHALCRELEEELGISTAGTDCVPITFASGAIDTGPLLLLLFRVRRWRGEPRALHADAIRWADIPALRSLPMPPADQPLVEALAGLSD